MAVAFRSATVAESASPAVPTGTVAGDLILLIVHYTSVSTPAGFTLLRTDGQTQTFYRVATGTDSISISGTNYVAFAATYSGVDTTTPFANSTTNTSPNGGPYVAPTATASRAGSMLVCHLGGSSYGGVGAVSWTPPAGMTERLDYSGTDPVGPYPYANTAADLAVGVGATGTRTFTPSSPNIGTVTGVSLILSPPSTTPYVPALML